MEEPKVYTPTPFPEQEEEEEEYRPTPQELGRQIVVQVVALVCLKVATGIVIKRLAKAIKDFDILYPESLDKIQWKDRV